MQLLPLLNLLHGFLNTGESLMYLEALIRWPLAQMLMESRCCYRPFPYHPFGSPQSFSDLADSEGTRLHPLFERYAQAAVARS